MLVDIDTNALTIHLRNVAKPRQHLLKIDRDIIDTFCVVRISAGVYLIPQLLTGYAAIYDFNIEPCSVDSVITRSWHRCNTLSEIHAYNAAVASDRQFFITICPRRSRPKKYEYQFYELVNGEVK